MVVWCGWLCGVQIAARSFKVFQKLHQHYVGASTLQRLALSFYVSVMADQHSKVRELFDIFMLPLSKDQSWDSLGWSVLVCMGYSMLSFSSVEYFGLGLDLLTRMLDSDVPPLQKTEWICSLKIWAVDGKQSSDEGLAAHLRKGLTHEKTVDASLWVLRRWAAICGEGLLSNNHAVLLLLLFNAMHNGLERVAMLEDQIRLARGTAADPDKQAARAKEQAQRDVHNHGVRELLAMYAASPGTPQLNSTLSLPHSALCSSPRLSPCYFLQSSPVCYLVHRGLFPCLSDVAGL